MFNIICKKLQTSVADCIYQSLDLSHSHSQYYNNFFPMEDFHYSFPYEQIMKTIWVSVRVFFFFFFLRHFVQIIIYEITRLTKIIFTLKKIIPVVENFQQPTSLPTGASVLDFKFNLRLITWIQEYLGNLKSHNLYIRPAMTNSQMKLTVCRPLLLNAKGSNLLK